ncbi:MAG TPA: alpha/beta fold hydrolase [Burkholderiales bacterium]|nr:alpha/beta fold hydrolase [Burkholderiales bacterium]
MLVIIHGWSDTSRSFEKLGRELAREGVVAGVRHVRLGDYVSLDDDVTFDDIAAALERAWHEEKLPTGARSVDVVVHSTGALVVRHWMTRKYTPATNPVRRFLMLAPANFGSPLAHKGRSFIGRIVKGFKSDKPFQTGAHILHGLELASPFTWDLATRDRFSAERWYGPGRVLATVLVGTSGYSGISGAANQPGTDGTVRVATANLNATYFRFDFTHEPPPSGKEPPPGRLLPPTEPNGLAAFARIPEENHSTIAFKDGGPRNVDTRRFIRRALQVTDADFEAFAGQLAVYSDVARADVADWDTYRHSFQDTVVRLRDDFGEPVDDFFIEVFAKRDDGRPDDAITCRIQEEVMQRVHPNDLDPSRRSLHLNQTALRTILGERPLYISLTAMPDIRKTGTVGYATLRYDDIGSIKLGPSLLEKFIQPDRTVLVDVVISRRQTDKVFRFSRLRA